ncbi:hypothetical protein NVS55_30895 [Myxococcus stipitatus]|uniref:hypothetical protein n=1 Tax=Myxococcus stipitatus TaxID=83455 RepID=UPI00314558C8
MHGVTPKLQWVAVGMVALVVATALPRLFARVFDSNFYELAASIQDDSFYYLLPAFHFKSKLFFTFDGVGPSYGFQPTYALFLTGLAFFYSDFESFFRGAMFMGVGLHVLTSLMVTLLVVRIVDAKASWLRWVQCGLAAAAGLFYFTRGTVLYSVMTCKENSLASALFVGVLLLATSRPSTERGRRWLSIGVGSALAALLLCRLLPTTLGILSLVGLVVLMRWRKPVALLASFALPIIAWGTYATLAFGHPLPTSVRVKALRHSVPVTWEIISTKGVEYLTGAFKFAMGLPGQMWVPQYDVGQVVLPSRQGSLWLALGFVVVAVLVVAAVQGVLKARRERVSLLEGVPFMVGMLALLAAGVCLAYVAQGSLIWTRRPGEFTYYIWYFFDLPVVVALSLGLAAVYGVSMLEGAVERLRARSGGVVPGALVASLGGVLALLAVSVLIARVPREYGKLSALKPYETFREVTESWSHNMMRSGMWLKNNVQLQPGDRVACFSCGALGMILPGHVLNLDGLANDEAARYLLGQSMTIEQYVDKVRPHYYIDVHTSHINHNPRVLVKQLQLLPFYYEPQQGYLTAELSYPQP